MQTVDNDDLRRQQQERPQQNETAAAIPIIPDRKQWHAIVNGDSPIGFMNVDLALGVNLPDIHEKNDIQQLTETDLVECNLIR